MNQADLDHSFRDERLVADVQARMEALLIEFQPRLVAAFRDQMGEELQTLKSLLARLEAAVEHSGASDRSYGRSTTETERGDGRTLEGSYRTSGLPFTDQGQPTPDDSMKRILRDLA